LCWFSASDGFLHFLCGAGAVLSLLLIFGIAPAPCLFLLWLIYLSLSVVCREFLSFQWDALLLETGFLAIFLSPLQLWPKRSETPGPSRIALWLLRWLLFRLMFESGLVKLASGDPTWRNLTALSFHYETQPLPTWVGWYVHQLPLGFHKVCVVLMFVIELGVPFLIIAPRRMRFFACGLFLLLQATILLTGNYAYFNLLAIALSLLLLDDAAVRRFIPAGWRRRFTKPEAAPNEAMGNPEEGKTLGEIRVPSTPVKRTGGGRLRWPMWVMAPIALVILLVSVPQLFTLLGWRSWPTLNLALYEWTSPFRSVNTYGLFAVMTTSRPEIIVEGSDDGVTWKAYEFRYKPGDVRRRPQFVAPHQPRLDWQMWFAALGTYRQNLWFVSFCIRLLEGSPEVQALLEKNPFPQKPPRYVRAVVYDYHFSNFKQRRTEGVWWRRELKGEYLPAVSLREKR
jgi:lipase maturation factor 1